MFYLNVTFYIKYFCELVNRKILHIKVRELRLKGQSMFIGGEVFPSVVGLKTQIKERKGNGVNNL